VTSPILSLRGYHPVGGRNGKTKPPGRGEHRVSLPAGSELGVEASGTAEPEYLLEEAGVVGEEDEAFSIGGK
jgi:hypothetical protein